MIERPYNNTTEYGPTTIGARQLHYDKYRGDGETFYDAMSRIADALADSEEHRIAFKDILLNQRFMPGGRIQSSMGSPRQTTPYNCFVSGTIEDSMDSIMQRAKEAAQTMRMGGGIGYDFSRLRPKGDRIVSLDSPSSGPISFMDIYDSICGTISSSGHRRGAQMGVLRVDHPDVEEFIRSKQNDTRLTRFNISVGVTNEFMQAVEEGKPFRQNFEGRDYGEVDARMLWNEIMRSTWDWAEPGVIFLDTMNDENNLWYVEELEATNPCAEQPLPPFGACLLGSFNLTKYLKPYGDKHVFNYDLFKADSTHVVRAMDNVVDKATYPLPEHEEEAKEKRRMGLGVTGLANCIEVLGKPYGSSEAVMLTGNIMRTLRDNCYLASIGLAQEKGAFPAYHKTNYLAGAFVQRLPKSLRDLIHKHGIRNSHLTSIAPTGTISLAADNVSSGVEPVFLHHLQRTIQTFDGPRIETVSDWAVREHEVFGRTANEITVQEHLNMLLAVQPYIDSAVSKTCNVADDVEWEEFKEVYIKAWKGGAKGLTTFRASGKRFGILNKVEEDSAIACYIDPETGQKECG